MNNAFIGELLALAWPGRHPQLLDRRRAEAIVARVRAFAALFAVLTVAWIAVDALVFDASAVVRLAIVRIVTGALFALLALSCGVAAPTMTHAYLRLAALFVIPSAFFVASQALLPAATPEGLPRGVAAAYSFLPFVLAAGIGAFPLAIAEAALLAAFAFAIEGWAVGGAQGPASAFMRLDALWLLFLIASVAAFAATSQLKLVSALVEQAIRDPLTGCLRRESGKELLELQFLLAVRQRSALAVMFADIDRFKAVNDSFGHDAGDRVLAAAASSLRGFVRESDLVLRWGGEEFVVVLPNTTGAEAVRLLDRARARGFGLLPDGKPVTLSIGIADCRADGIGTSDALVELADQRMYRAKQAGRNRYVSSGGEASPILALA